MMEDTRRTWPTESTKQKPHGLTESEAASTGVFMGLHHIL